MHKETKKQFSSVIKSLYEYASKHTKKKCPMVSDSVYKIVMDNAERFNSAIIYDRDYNYSYFGFKTLEKSYLLKIDGLVAERPQHLLMRVSIGIHKEDIEL